MLHLEGEKLLGILRAIQDNHEVSMYYKRHLMRHGLITRDKKPITGKGRPGFYYSLTEKAQQMIGGQ